MSHRPRPKVTLTQSRVSTPLFYRDKLGGYGQLNHLHHLFTHLFTHLLSTHLFIHLYILHTSAYIFIYVSTNSSTNTHACMYDR